MENKDSSKLLHTASIINREKIEITGAVEVLSSTDTNIVARICDYVMEIYGSGLRVAKLVPENGELIVTGKINDVKYDSKINKKTFLGKVFK